MTCIVGVVETAHGYAAVGCGQQVALGALAATDDHRWDPESRIETALRAAERHNIGVRGPFILAPPIRAKPRRKET